ncbi:GNAT family N-acetyltransferase [Marivirga sp. S37H4]|uniref:GNAT family N-acetyltransferase n=1 Tax=Marivirga aurantiaca TaxID=2802615 RepID=A0A935CDW5_9BACT|nr:GNAT family N-acetyltransferase [Marivirga aurantiaca]
MIFRKAKQEDLPAIVQLLANDPLGSTREDFTIPVSEKYQEAFRNINNDPHQELIVAEAKTEAEIVGTLQLSFIQYLTYQGGIRAQIEAVRVSERYRGNKVGQQMINWTIDRAKARKAHLIQLTTDKMRPDALRFYERLGFKASHEGMKMRL